MFEREIEKKGWIRILNCVISIRRKVVVVCGCLHVALARERERYDGK